MKRFIAVLMAAFFALTPLECVFALSASFDPDGELSAVGDASATDATETDASPTDAEPAGPTPAPTPIPTPTPIPKTIPLGVPPSTAILKNGDTGDEVIRIQKRLRDLGYYNYIVTGQFGNFTEKALKAFQANHELKADGVMGAETSCYLYSGTALRGEPAVARATPKPTPKKTSAPRKGEIVDWSKAKNFVARFGGSKFLVKDYRSGTEYYMRRVGGSLHMDVAPATKADTAKFKSTYGGRWSWNRRPVIVRFGSKWYAASINGMPHGSQSVKGNGMTGQVCIHFKNSKTHVREMIDPDHKRCVEIAAGLR